MLQDFKLVEIARADRDNKTKAVVQGHNASIFNAPAAAASALDADVLMDHKISETTSSAVTRA